MDRFSSFGESSWESGYIGFTDRANQQWADEPNTDGAMARCPQ